MVCETHHVVSSTSVGACGEKQAYGDACTVKTVVYSCSVIIKMNAAVGDKYTYELVKLFEQEGRKGRQCDVSSRAGPGGCGECVVAVICCVLNVNKYLPVAVLELILNVFKRLDLYNHASPVKPLFCIVFGTNLVIITIVCA